MKFMSAVFVEGEKDSRGENSLNFSYKINSGSCNNKTQSSVEFSSIAHSVSK